MSLRKLCELIPRKVYCMYLDSEELVIKAKEEGVNVVEIEKYR